YYLLAWNRVLRFIDTLPEKIKTEEQKSVSPSNNGEATSAKHTVAIEEKATIKDYTKQLLIIQLMQAEGIFPINNALEGVTQTDIYKLISRITGMAESVAAQALHHASAILLKREITLENIAERISLLEELETFFDE